ncbi:hypothetical protein ACTA71_001909 [Dictyostelium dimigraforme]
MNRTFSFSTKVATSINRCNNRNNNNISQSVSYNFINKPTVTTTSASTTSQPSFTLPTSCNSNSSQSNLNSFRPKSQSISQFSSNLLGTVLFEFQAFLIDDSIVLITKSSKNGIKFDYPNSNSISNGVIVGGNNVSGVNCGGCGDYDNNDSSWYERSCGCKN